MTIFPGKGGGGGASSRELIILKDVKTAGTDGGSSVAEVITTRTLNNEVDPNGNCTLASNQFTLAAGEYGLLSARSTFYDPGRTILCLYDVTNLAYYCGRTVYGFGSDPPVAVIPEIHHWVGTLSGNTTFEIRYVADVARVSFGLGLAASPEIVNLPPGYEEVYTEVLIEDLN